jgi:D-sedoheptulose 7-phosphate isomerase
LLTVGLTGNEGGRMMQSAAVDFCINAASDHIPRIQEAQATVYHALLEVIHTLVKERTDEYEICR